MEFKRWALGGALLLSAGALSNCSQIFGGGGGSAEGITTAMLIGAERGRRRGQLDQPRAHLFRTALFPA